MSVVIPTLLERANKEGAEVHKETSARLLELAGADQTAFRATVGGMTEEQKGFMESVIVAGREAMARQAARSGSLEREESEPTIALKSFGS